MPGEAPPSRRYEAAHLKALMDDAGGWAGNWQDVLRHLRESPQNAGGFTGREVPGMMDDVKRLDDERVRFTRDYRKMWQKLTGEDATHLPPPAYADPHDLDPFELQRDYFEELAFPSARTDILRAARQAGAPGRVMDRIEMLEDRIYRDRDELLEVMKDANWNTERAP